MHTLSTTFVLKYHGCDKSVAEGGRIYENSGFFKKTHIQICVRNPASIKAVFRLRKDQLQEIGIQ